MSAPKLVYCEWVDSCSGRGWAAVEHEKDEPPPLCRTVGWLLIDGKHVKSIAPSVTVSGRMACDVMSIPTIAVKRLLTLREPPKAKR